MQQDQSDSHLIGGKLNTDPLERVSFLWIELKTFFYNHIQFHLPHNDSHFTLTCW